IKDYVKGVVEGNSDLISNVITELEKSALNLQYFYNEVLEELRVLLKQSMKDSHISVKRLVKLISILLEGYANMKNSPIEILSLEIASSKIRAELGGLKSGNDIQQESNANVSQIVKKTNSAKSEKPLKKEGKVDTAKSEEEEEVSVSYSNNIS